ncbi:ATPase [Paenibacillus swuensis]|uniref:ATPase n=1 Tax=Paenibacillus swuensis TaxID=1178515 RepID=A0A172TG46_9BACL|nr:DNA polymerase III subunit delta' [Paenibacillus swuensis]ANE46011.1 ATPase [Paenibacillus swuensis]
MSFGSIIGQERAKKMLQNGLRLGRTSHAYIFSGPSGTGRREMAFALAKAIFCTERTDDACGHCLECRKVEHGNHPDLHYVQPDGTSIKIEQIRNLQKEFAYRATASQSKIYILTEAEKMTVQAANSLLKFLEEPQSAVVAILISENGHALLPTIQSRAQWIPFQPLPPQMMADLLEKEGHSQVLVRSAVHLAAGIDACREIIQLNWFAEIRNVMIQLVKECITRFAAALITAQQKVFKTNLAEHIDTLLQLFVLWFKDMVHIQSGRQDSIVFVDQSEWMAKHAFSRELSYWVGCMEKALELTKRLKFHVNPQLAFEQFVIDIQGG